MLCSKTSYSISTRKHIIHLWCGRRVPKTHVHYLSRVKSYSGMMNMAGGLSGWVWLEFAVLACRGALSLPAFFFLNTLWIDCYKHKAAFSDTVEKQKCKLSAVYLLRKQSAVQWCHERPCVHTSFPLFPYLLYRIMISLYKLCSLLHSGKMAAIPLCIKLYFSTEKKCKNGTCFLFFPCILAKLRCIIYLPTL